MQLVYVYISKYKKISNLGLNISPEFSFEYRDESKKILFCSKFKDKCINLYSEYNISCLTAIVGENGCGKTSILDFIKEASRNEITLKNGDALVFYDEVNNELISNKSITGLSADINLKLLDDYRREQNHRNVDLHGNHEMSVVTYSEVFNISKINDMLLKPQEYRNDLSVAGRMHRYLKDNERQSLVVKDYFKIYENEEFKVQINALDTNMLKKFNITKIDIAYMDYERKIALIMKEKCQYDYYDDLYKEKEENDGSNELKDRENFCRKLKNVCKLLNKNNDIIGYAMVYSLLCWYFYTIGIENNYSKDIVVLNAWLDIFNNPAKMCHHNDIVKVFFKQVNLPGEIDDHYLKFIECLYRLEKNKSISTSIYGYRLYLNTTEDIDRIKTFYYYYNVITAGIYDFLTFSWPMSSGELAYFNMYAHLKTVKARSLNTLLMLDEVDLYMHPRWQQEYVSRLVNIVQDVFTIVKCQIILATHSPVILSDIPSTNIVYIKNGINVGIDNSKRTLAQNIYSLYMDSFFLNKNNNIWIHGDFIDNVLKKISLELQGYLDSTTDISEEKINKIEDVVDLIGEDLIRMELKKKIKLVKERSNIISKNNASNNQIIAKIKKMTNIPDSEMTIIKDILDDYDV